MNKIIENVLKSMRTLLKKSTYKKWSTTLLVKPALLTVILLGLVFVLWLFYFIVLVTFGTDFQKWGPFGDSFGVINTLFSGFAFALIAISIWFQRKDLQISIQELQKTTQAQTQLAEIAAKERTDRTLHLFHIFRYEHMVAPRELAWEARIKWFTNEDYRHNLTQRIYPKTRDFTIRERFSEKEWREFNAVQDILEYYSILAVHPASDDELRALGGFYYVWWRGFLHQIRDAYIAEYNSMNLSEAESNQLPLPSWVKLLDVLESRLGLPPYDQRLHPIDKHFLNADIPPKKKN